MVHFSDDLYLGNMQALGSLKPTGGGNPTQEAGVGPMGRVAFHNVVPLTASKTNIAASQHMTSGTALTMTAGTGVTAGTAPDGSNSRVMVLDTPRCVSLTSTANLSAINFTLTAFDQYGAKFTSTIAGPNANTVNFPKAAVSVLSIVPGTTDGTNNVSAGTSDVFGLPYAVADGNYVIPRWAGALGFDQGTLVTADATSPATASTGDVRGTYAPSSPSNGTKRMTIWLHLTEAQCGATATLAGALGVTQA